jgi:hypothetical protein
MELSIELNCSDLDVEKVAKVLAALEPIADIGKNVKKGENGKLVLQLEDKTLFNSNP